MGFRDMFGFLLWVFFFFVSVMQTVDESQFGLFMTVSLSYDLSLHVMRSQVLLTTTCCLEQTHEMLRQIINLPLQERTVYLLTL